MGELISFSEFRSWPGQVGHRPLPQEPPQDLPRWALGYCVDELDATRQSLGPAHSLHEPGLDLLGGGPFAGTENDIRTRRFGAIPDTISVHGFVAS
jgi:hypothetical protein